MDGWLQQPSEGPEMTKKFDCGGRPQLQRLLQPFEGAATAQILLQQLLQHHLLAFSSTASSCNPCNRRESFRPIY